MTEKPATIQTLDGWRARPLRDEESREVIEQLIMPYQGALVVTVPDTKTALDPDDHVA